MSIKVGDKVRVKGFHVSATEYENMIGIVEALGEEIALVKINDRPIKIPLWQLVKVEEPQEPEPKRGDEITLTREQFKDISVKASSDLMKEHKTGDIMLDMALNLAAVIALRNAAKYLFGEPSENA